MCINYLLLLMLLCIISTCNAKVTSKFRNKRPLDHSKMTPMNFVDLV